MKFGGKVLSGAEWYDERTIIVSLYEGGLSLLRLTDLGSVFHYIINYKKDQPIQESTEGMFIGAIALIPSSGTLIAAFNDTKLGESKSDS